MARTEHNRGLKAAWVGVADKYFLEFRRDGKLVGYHKFNEFYAAQEFLDQVRRNNTLKWVSHTEAEIGNHVTVKSPDLEKIVEYEKTEKEKEWELPIPYPGYVASILGVNREFHEQKAEARRNAPAEPKEPKAPRVPRPSKDGLVTIQDICKELKVEPRDARATLRKSNVPKPDAGWAWPKGQVDAIKKTIKAGAK